MINKFSFFKDRRSKPILNISVYLNSNSFFIKRISNGFSDLLDYDLNELNGRGLNIILSEDSLGRNVLDDAYIHAIKKLSVTEPRILLSRSLDKIFCFAHIAYDIDIISGGIVADIYFVEIGAGNSVLRDLILKESKNVLPSEKSLNALVDSSGRALWASSGLLGYANSEKVALQKFSHQFTLKIDDYLKNDCLIDLKQIMHEEDIHAYESAISDGIGKGLEFFEFDARIRRHEGIYKWFSIKFSSVLAQFDRSFWLCNFVDIDAKKVFDEKTKSMQRVESLGQLTGGLAHDFNNLLSVVIGNLDLLQMETFSRDDKRNSDRLRLALSAAEKGTEIVKSLLALASRQNLTPKVINLNDFLERMYPILNHSKSDSCKLSIRTVGHKLLVRIDPAAFEAALLNLVVNSRDSIKGIGKIFIESKYYNKDSAVISIEDNGCGMSGEVIERALEPFFTTKETGRGTGLGLSMVAGFVKQSKGEIKISSIVGCGTIIQIFLPLCPGSYEKKPRHEDELSRVDPLDDSLDDSAKVVSHDEFRDSFINDFSRSPGVDLVSPVLQGSLFLDLPNPILRGKSILIVDDVQGLTSVIEDWLTFEGCRTFRAASAKEALEVLSMEPIDVLLSDVVMPGEMDGIGLAVHCRMAYPGVKTILMSGYSRELVTADEVTGYGRRKGNRRAANLNYAELPWTVLVKPFKRSDLLFAVSSLLNEPSILNS
jgi:signal transduction histidine kinase/CheY-like chemotaxis protein